MNIAAFNWADSTILGVVAFSTLISFVRGFVREAISLASWIAAFWVAHKYGHDFGTHFLTMIEMGQMRSLVASAILFFAVLMVGAFINYSVNSVIHVSGLSAIDRILGMAFGFARGVLLIAVLILLGQVTQMDKKPWWVDSQAIPEFAGISEWLKSFVPEQFEKLKPLGEPKSQLPNNAVTPQQTAPTQSSLSASDNTKSEDSNLMTKVIPTDINLLSPPDKKQPPATTEQVKTTQEPVVNPTYY